jgi:hypothetical protein
LGDYHLPLGLLSTCNRPLEVILARLVSLLLLINVIFGEEATASSIARRHFIS